MSAIEELEAKVATLMVRVAALEGKSPSPGIDPKMRLGPWIRDKFSDSPNYWQGSEVRQNAARDEIAHAGIYKGREEWGVHEGGHTESRKGTKADADAYLLSKGYTLG